MCSCGGSVVLFDPIPSSWDCWDEGCDIRRLWLAVCQRINAFCSAIPRLDVALSRGCISLQQDSKPSLEGIHTITTEHVAQLLTDCGREKHIEDGIAPPLTTVTNSLTDSVCILYVHMLVSTLTYL